MFAAMLRLSRILALVAAIMLVIGSAPVVAAEQPCDPCPPDCPMMQVSLAGDHQKAPDGGKANPSCKQDVLCQAGVTVSAEPSQMEFVPISAETVDHRLANALPARSRPPDRSLRPPIQL